MAVLAGPLTNLKEVIISYIIFSPRKVPFTAYGNKITETGFSGTAYADLKSQTIVPDYALLGLTRANFESSIDLSA